MESRETSPKQNDGYVMKDREVWRLNLKMLPPQPSRKSGQRRKKKKKKIIMINFIKKKTLNQVCR